MCDDCMVMYTASIDIEAEPLEAEASDDTTELIIKHALNQYFKAVNDELQPQCTIVFCCINCKQLTAKRLEGRDETESQRLLRFTSFNNDDLGRQSVKD